MGTNKLAPGRGLFSFWDWGEVMPLQDVADRLVAYRITHVLQRPDNAIIPPCSILFGELDDELLDSWIDSGPSWIMALRGPVKLFCDELPVPGENRLRLDDGGNILEGLFPQSLAELGQRVALGIDELHPGRDLLPQNAVFRHEIFIPQQQFLVDRTCDVAW